jgi:hypothetical protein
LNNHEDEAKYDAKEKTEITKWRARMVMRSRTEMAPKVNIRAAPRMRTGTRGQMGSRASDRVKGKI